MPQIPYDTAMDEERVKLLVKQRKLHITDLPEHLKNDISIAKVAVEYHYQILQYLNTELRDNKEIIKLALVFNSSRDDKSIDNIAANELQWASDRLKNDEELAQIALKRHGRAFSYLSKRLQNNKEIALLSLNNGGSYYDLPEQLKDDRELTKIAISYNGHSLSYASDRLKDDKELVLLAFNNEANIYNDLSDKLKNDIEVIEGALHSKYKDGFRDMPDWVRNNKDYALLAVATGGNLQYVSENLKDDFDVVSKAIKNYPFAIQHASDRLKDNKEIGLIIAGSYGSAFSDLSDNLKNVPEIVLQSLTNNPSIYIYLNDDFKNNREYALLASKSGSNLKSMPLKFQDDKEIVMNALKDSHYSFEYCSNRLREDIDVLKVYVKRNNWSNYKDLKDQLYNNKEKLMALCEFSGDLIQWANPQLRNDKELISKSVEYNGLSLMYASYDLRNDKDIASIAVKQNGYAIEYVGDDLYNDFELKLLAAAQNGKVLENYSFDLRNNKEIVLAAVKSNAISLDFASARLKDDKEIALAAIENTSMALRLISERLSNDPEVVLAACLKDSRADNANKIFFAGAELKERIGDNDPIEFLKNEIVSQSQSRKVKKLK